MPAVGVTALLRQGIWSNHTVYGLNCVFMLCFSIYRLKFSSFVWKATVTTFTDRPEVTAWWVRSVPCFIWLEGKETNPQAGMNLHSVGKCRQVDTCRAKVDKKKQTEAGVRKAGEQRVREFNGRIPTDGWSQPFPTADQIWESAVAAQEPEEPHLRASAPLYSPRLTWQPCYLLTAHHSPSTHFPPGYTHTHSQECATRIHTHLHANTHTRS